MMIDGLRIDDPITVVLVPFSSLRIVRDYVCVAPEGGHHRSRNSERTLWADDEGIWWARGHGEDIEAALRLVWSARQ